MCIRSKSSSCNPARTARGLIRLPLRTGAPHRSGITNASLSMFLEACHAGFWDAGPRIPRFRPDGRMRPPPLTPPDFQSPRFVPCGSCAGMRLRLARVRVRVRVRLPGLTSTLAHAMCPVMRRYAMCPVMRRRAPRLGVAPVLVGRSWPPVPARPPSGGPPDSSTHLEGDSIHKPSSKLAGTLQ